MNGRSALAVCFLLIPVLPVASQPPDDPEIFANKLHPKAVVVGSGGTYGDSVLALESERGLVVIDTGTTVALTRAYRARIEEVFGRTDFAYVINTHYHYDHTVGNQVFPEATVIGHHETPERLLAWHDDLEGFIVSQRGRVEAWKRAAASLDPGDPRVARLQDVEYAYSRMCDDLESGFELRVPTVTFSERLTLNLGDLSLRLYTWGPGTHTGDDIVVHVPEANLVATGDLFHHDYVQFLNRLGPGIDVDHKLAVLDAVLADPTLKYIVPVHSRVLTRSELESRRDYLAGMWDEVQSLTVEGATLEDARRQILTEDTFSSLSGTGAEESRLAEQVAADLTMMWLAARDGQDASVAISRALETGGIAEARVAFEKILPLMDEKFYFDENSINNLGYALLAEDRIDEAVAVFEMNVIAFPESGNTHDSLGEALAAQGDLDLAITSYRRSLEIDPENHNAALQIERLQAMQSES